jgi:HEPN domain-containing protein
MGSVWTVYPWHDGWLEIDRSADPARPLDADALLEAFRPTPSAAASKPPRTTEEVRALREEQRKERRRQPSVADLVFYADVAYAPARVLTQASEAVHAEALYCVGQTIEKYLKAVWLAKSGSQATTGHDLSLLALTLAETYADLTAFADPEFVMLCEHLQPFEEAGRYPDHKLDGWGFDPELLTFLDGFVAHCKRLLTDLGVPNSDTAIAQTLRQPGASNPVMAAATRAVAEHNRYLLGLLGKGG